MTNARVQQMSAWSGLVFLAVFFLGWGLIAGFLPPPSPLASGEDMARFYQADNSMILLGLLMIQISTVFFIPWVALISEKIKGIPNISPICTYTQFLSGISAMLALVLPFYFWTVAAFRVDRSPELVLLLNDIAWLIFTMTFAPFVAQNVAIAVAAFSDKRAQPVFPRWVAYFNLWVAFLFLPAGLILFFKEGPFAWNGLVAFWVPVVIFGIWFFAMFYVLNSAIKRQLQSEVAQ